MNCSMCGEGEAIYKDKRPILYRGTERYSYYCKGCANGGVAFGWLEAEDLERM